MHSEAIYSEQLMDHVCVGTFYLRTNVMGGGTPYVDEVKNGYA